jgi:molybdenum cofactor cytidylyltransferase
MNSDEVTAIILAGGLGERMGALKPLLPFGKSFALERLVRMFRFAGIDDIRVVTGHRADEIAPNIESLGARCIHNKNFRNGMFSSMKTGITSLEADRAAFFILPADIPLVRHQTVQHILNAWPNGEKDILYPCFQGERGHPPLISARYVGNISNWNGKGGMRGFLEQHENRALNIPVADEFILMDMDTPVDYQQALKNHRTRSIPTERECLALMADVFDVDKKIISHCREVSRLATHIGTVLANAGVKLDIPRITAAGLVHDIAREHPCHADRGARILEDFGFSGVARIVGDHMDICIHENHPIDEREIVYIADKLVKGNRIVTLEARFREKAVYMAQNPEALDAMETRFENAVKIRRRIELQTGIALDSVVKAYKNMSIASTNSNRFIFPKNQKSVIRKTHNDDLSSQAW